MNRFLHYFTFAYNYVETWFWRIWDQHPRWFLYAILAFIIFGWIVRIYVHFRNKRNHKRFLNRHLRADWKG